MAGGGVLRVISNSELDQMEQAEMDIQNEAEQAIETDDMAVQ